MKQIIITEQQLYNITQQTLENNMIEYIKHFGNKGKLPPASQPLKNYFTPYLQQAYEWASNKLSDVKRNGFPYFKMLLRNNVLSNFKLNKRGLIYVERSIDVDTTKDLNSLEYKSVGECWSWKPKNSKSYCSMHSLTANTSNIVLCGYVHPDSINWLETLYLNSYDMKNETEIRLNDNATVEISYIKINNQKHKLNGTYLINASADKYQNKDWD